MTVYSNCLVQVLLRHGGADDQHSDGPTRVFVLGLLLTESIPTVA